MLFCFNFDPKISAKYIYSVYHLFQFYLNFCMVQYFGIILLPLNPVYYYSEIYDPVLKQWKQCGIFLIYSWITGYQPACEKTSMTFHDFLHFSHSLIPTFFSFFFYFFCVTMKKTKVLQLFIYMLLYFQYSQKWK